MKIREYSKEGLKFINVDNGVLNVTLCNLGASIYSIIFDGKYMTQTPISEKDFATPCFYGKTIGRVGNRIKGNEIVVDEVKYTLLNNEGPNTLHGGVGGISTKLFSYDSYSDEDKIVVCYKYVSPDGECGFPGNLFLCVRYEILEKSSRIKVEFNANADKTTPCSLTNHAYFILGEMSDSKLQLKINASNYLECQKADLLPIGKKPVSDVLDFRSFKCITKQINAEELQVNNKAKGYDHHFYFDKVVIDKPQVTLKSDSLFMNIYTDFSGTQCYTDNYKNDTPCYEMNFDLHRSIAIEPQEDFLTLHLLRPGNEYKHFIIYEFGKI